MPTGSKAAAQMRDLGSSFAGKLVLVTGAAHGIGRATALLFSRLEARLELLDVDLEALESTARDARASGAREVVARQVNVSDGAAIREVAAAVHASGRAVDVLVNNAGVGLVGNVLDTEIEDWDWLLGVNLWGVLHTVRAFAPPMVGRGSGQIVNVASSAGFLGTAGLGAYAASKHAVLAVSESLREELRPSGVGVSTVCPGVVSTAMARRVRIRGNEAPAEARARLERVAMANGTSPERVAEAIVRAAKDNPALVPVSAEALGLYFLKRFFPRITPHVVRHVVRSRRERDRAHDVG